jgi:hypothetical protein
MSNKKRIDKYLDSLIIVDKLPDYSNDPAFKKLKEEAIEFIKKHGLPASYKKKNKYQLRPLFQHHHKPTIPFHCHTL